MTAQGDEQAQRRALARYAVLETPPDPTFDELAELARTVAGTAAAGIGFLDHDRLWFKSALGFQARDCPRDALPIRRPNGDGGTGSTADTAAVGVSPEPVTIAGHRFGFCAAAPIVTAEGYLLGELLVLDGRPQTLSEAQAASLLVLGRQVQARLELRRTVLAYHAVVDGVGHVVFQLDEAHRLVSLTPTWSRLTGFGPVRSVGRPLLDFVHPDDRGWVGEQLRALAGGEVATTFECRLLRLIGGGDLPVEIIARPLIDEGQRHRGLVGVMADISERKARAVEAQHAQKLEALGRLSAGLAHEINTPIQFVGDNTRFLLNSYRTLAELLQTYQDVLAPTASTLPERARERIRRAEQDADVDFLAQEIPAALHQTLEGVDRVATLVRAMRTFSHPGQDRQAPADLNEAIESAVTVTRNQVVDVADITLALSPLPLVSCTIGDLNQVFLNLLVNAADAIADRGQRGMITISTRADGPNVVIAVSDTGIGIPDQLRQRIFEPFFTTKEVGRGTGQGLALARAVVYEKHGGRIALDSEVGRGSTFTITLPIAGRPQA